MSKNVNMRCEVTTPLGVSHWNTNTDEIIGDMKRQGVLLDAVLRDAPASGLVLVPAYGESCTSLYVGWITKRQSRWWISCSIPGAGPGDPMVQQALRSLKEVAPSVTVLDQPGDSRSRRS
jgi:hypothetical protein